MSEQTAGTVQSASPEEQGPEIGRQATERAPEAAVQPESEATAQPALETTTAEPEPEATTAEPTAPKAKRPFPWRWLGAVTATLAVGAGCAFAVMAPKRTDLPGLATASDGRYDFAPLTLPTLAPGQADPYDPANDGGQHLADIRKLLLPAPEGATPDKSLPGSGGWVPESATIADTGITVEDLTGYGWRHTAGVAWKTPDGAETRIYLVQFIDDLSAQNADTAFTTGFGDPSAPYNSFEPNSGVQVTYEKQVSGGTTTWYGRAQSQDAEFLIVYKAPSSVGLAPFEQEADLQVELLQ